jgi:hypothetical protein
MFGLSDNNDNKYADTTQLSASDSTQEAQQPQPPLSAGGPMPAAPADLNTGYGAAAPPVSSSSQPGSGSTSYNTSAPAASAPAPATGGMGDVKLDNAYITTSPPAMPAVKDSASDPKPTAASLVNGSNEDELLKLKQQALQNLAPLVDHLDQDPEAKFKTTMMMIQASDNAELIPEAYEAANKITDEKLRAQALLDVVNEINYFTQQANSTLH